MIWSIEKFRVANYTFDKYVDFKGVELMQFRIDDAELKACTYEYDNECSPSPTMVPSQTTPSPTMEPTTMPTLEPTSEPSAAPTCDFIIGESHTCKYFQFWEDGVANLTNLRGSPSFMSKGRFLDAPFFQTDTNE